MSRDEQTNWPRKLKVLSKNSSGSKLICWRAENLVPKAILVALESGEDAAAEIESLKFTANRCAATAARTRANAPTLEEKNPGTYVARIASTFF